MINKYFAVILSSRVLQHSSHGLSRLGGPTDWNYCRVRSQETRRAESTGMQEIAGRRRRSPLVPVNSYNITLSLKYPSLYISSDLLISDSYYSHSDLHKYSWKKYENVNLLSKNKVAWIYTGNIKTSKATLSLVEQNENNKQTNHKFRCQNNPPFFRTHINMLFYGYLL